MIGSRRLCALALCLSLSALSSPCQAETLSAKDYVLRVRKSSVVPMVDYCVAKLPAMSKTFRSVQQQHLKHFEAALDVWIARNKAGGMRIDLEERRTLLQGLVEDLHWRTGEGQQREPADYCRDVVSSLQYPPQYDFWDQIGSIVEARDPQRTAVSAAPPPPAPCLPEVLSELKPVPPLGQGIAAGVHEVVARALVARDGKVMAVRLVRSSDPRLVDAVATALRGTRFKPHQCGDEQGEWIEQDFRFKYD